jgi:hypothetical protein
MPTASHRRIPITVSAADVKIMRRIERYILAYDGDNLLHDIDLNFPGVSFRAVFLALGRAQNAALWFEPEGAA